MSEPTIHTIGHSNHPIEHFIELLQSHRIEVVVDVRTSPYCGYSIHFNREALQATLTQTGFKYIFMGEEVGGQPRDGQFYDAEGHVLYWKIAESSKFKAGIERLRKGMDLYRVAIMCSEENPSVCHRRLLISRVLHEAGVRVAHIRGDGRIETETDLRKAETQSRIEQLSLFEENQPGERDRWKSLRSGLQRKAQPNSSDFSEEPE